MNKATCIVLLILALPVFAVQAEQQEPSRVDIDSSRWEETIEKFRKADQQDEPPKGAVLFVGSSTIRGWKTAEFFEGIDTINRGFGGSTIPDVLSYMDDLILKHEPSVVVFYSGDNDVARGQPAKYVAEDFQSLVQQTHEALPDTHIVLIPIKPSVSRWKLWPKMSDANQRMAEICGSDERLIYLDMADTLLDDQGQPIPKRLPTGCT